MDFLDDELTPEEQQAALLSALQKRMGVSQQSSDFGRAWGNMGMLSGDKVLSGFGQEQLQDAQHQERMGSAFPRALGKFKAPKTPEELEAIAARAARDRSVAENYGKTGAAPNPLRDENLRLRNESMKQKLASGGEGSKKVDDDIFKWSGRVPAGTLDGLSSIKQMNDIAAEFGGVDKVPGVGLGAGWKPGQALPPKADLFRRTGVATIAKFRNKLFGASLSDNERADFQKIADLGGQATAAQVANAMAILEKGFNSDARQALAGAPDHAKEAIFRDIGMPSAKVSGSGLTKEQRRAEIERLRKKAAEEGAQ